MELTSTIAAARGARMALACLALAAVLCPGRAQAADSPPTKENALIAALVYKIMAYVTWPESAFSRIDGDQFNVCGYGEDPLQGALTSLAQRQAAGREISLFYLTEDQPLAQRCHLLFIDAEEDVESAIELTRNQPTLTISDAQEFADLGGMIEIRKNRNRFGFLINRNAALDADLLIAAPLLELSTVVVGDR